MDTRSFLKAILPERGIKFVQRIKPRPGKKDATILYPAADSDDAATQSLELDIKFGNDNIYYAMASYNEAKEKTVQTKDGKDFTYVVGRTQENALNVKSLWFDLDVGKPGSYVTQREAAAGILKYVAATGLPTPVILSSGYGVHCYWIFTEEVAASEWESIAKYQRAAWRHLGILVDPACDQDCARVLRAPGTRNKKAGKEPKVVKVIRDEINALPAQEYKRLLRGYVERNNLGMNVKPDTPEWAKGTTGNLDAALPEFPDSYAKIAVNHCGQMKEFRATGGTSEPMWHAHIGLLKHFKDGEALAHEWGAKHEAYDQGETDSKLAQWKVGPTTCTRFKELNESACSGCEHKCTSPIALGLSEEVAKPNLHEMAATAVSEVETAAIVALTDSKMSDEAGVPLGWPDGFGYDKKGDRVTMRLKDENDVWQEVGIATPLFYPVEQICQEDGTYALRMHVWVRGRPREFMLPTKYTADPRSLKMQLAANRIHVKNEKGAASYLSNHMVNITRLREETNTYRQMGWQHDFSAFLLGDMLITPKEIRSVKLGKAFPEDLLNSFGVKGEKQQWVDAVNTLFNREHGEPYQFAVCAAFSSILNPLLGFSEWSGIPYALTSDKSGYSKSTVNKIAMSIWMRQTKATVVSDSTPKAILGMASAMNNVPFLLDEVTGYLKDPKDQADTLYALSNGAPRRGMTSEGTMRTAIPGWSGNYAMTGNRNIMLQVTENKLNPEAAQMRVFEIDLMAYPRIATMVEGSPDYKKFNAEHGLLARTIVEDSYGHIGIEFIRYIMANLEEVRDRLRKVSMGMNKYMEGGDATKERFYYHLITTVLVGGYYAKKLGYHDFNLNHLRDWCVKHVEKLRGAVKECQNTPEDQFASMMSDMVGKIIVTKSFQKADGRTTAEFPMSPVRNPICGRYATGDEKEKAQLYVTVASVRQWCAEQGVQYNTLRREFLRAGLIKTGLPGTNKDTGTVRVAVGKGVQGVPHLGNPMCLELDAARAADIIKLPTIVYSDGKAVSA